MNSSNIFERNHVLCCWKVNVTCTSLVGSRKWLVARKYFPTTYNIFPFYISPCYLEFYCCLTIHGLCYRTVHVYDSML